MLLLCSSDQQIVVICIEESNLAIIQFKYFIEESLKYFYYKDDILLSVFRRNFTCVDLPQPVSPDIIVI
jgi:hypothetical protein